MINSIIDISHHNTIQSFTDAQQAGIMGIFHKATQGLGYFDPTFIQNREKIADAGLLFGAYHFGVGGDPVAQADFFLSKIGNNTLMVLDFEKNTQGEDMTFKETEQFVHRIWEITGRYPGLYSSNTLKEAIANEGITDPGQTELSNCWLWIAQYGRAQPTIPGIWSDWTIWQYTDGNLGNLPHEVDGIGPCDRNFFNGTADDLNDFWAKNSG